MGRNAPPFTQHTTHPSHPLSGWPGGKRAMQSSFPCLHFTASRLPPSPSWVFCQVASTGRGHSGAGWLLAPARLGARDSSGPGGPAARATSGAPGAASRSDIDGRRWSTGPVSRPRKGAPVGALPPRVLAFCFYRRRPVYRSRSRLRTAPSSSGVGPPVCRIRRSGSCELRIQ